MKVVVLTRNPAGLAARFVERGAVPVAAVLVDEGAIHDRRAYLRRKLRKLRKVGPGGVFVGLALRQLYEAAAPAKISVDDLPVPVIRVPTLNGEEARLVLRELAPDIAVSLENTLISEQTFSLPRLGTINVHHGAVPEYRGGPPVFWELRDGRPTVGFTVHLIDAGIDTGPVLASGEVPVVRRPTLTAALAATIPALYEASLDALEATLAGSELIGMAQGGDIQFRTTPRLRDYLAVRKALRSYDDAR